MDGGIRFCDCVNFDKWVESSENKDSNTEGCIFPKQVEIRPPWRQKLTAIMPHTRMCCLPLILFMFIGIATAKFDDRENAQKESSLITKMLFEGEFNPVDRCFI